MAEVHNSGILLESGTNEIEIMEFTIDGSLYGINVAKVREIIMSAPVKVMPYRLPSMVNSIISISLVPDSKRIPLLCTSAISDTPHSI